MTRGFRGLPLNGVAEAGLHGLQTVEAAQVQFIGSGYGVDVPVVLHRQVYMV